MMDSPNQCQPCFARGAIWVRADFHLHTIKDPGLSRKFRSEFSGRENDFVKEWIAQLVKQDVRVAVVTNHNHFDRDEYKALRKAGATAGILVLPGVELGIKEGQGVHTLIVFSPDWVMDQANGDGIERFLAAQFATKPNEGTRTKDDLSECLKSLEQFGKDYFVIFAHVESDNGLIKEVKWGLLKELIQRNQELWSRRILGLQRVKDLNYYRENWPTDLVPLPSFVEGSDPKALAEVGKCEHGCYLKLGELNFDSVKFALNDHAQRVSPSRPTEVSGPQIHNIRFVGGRFDGQQFDVAAGLTTLIGSRGSGKSAVLECLRYALELEASVVDTKYKNDLVSVILGNGGEVIVSGINQHGHPVEIKRAAGFAPQVRVEGRDTRLRPSDVFPGVLYFGQKDLGNRKDSFESEFFGRLTGIPTAESRHQEEQLIEAVRRAVDDYQSALKSRDRDDEFAQERERLKDQLAVFEKFGVEKQLESLTTFDSDKRAIADASKSVSGLETAMSEIELTWTAALNEWPQIKSASLQSPQSRLQQSLQLLTAAKAQFEQVRGTLKEIQSELDLAATEVAAVENSLQDDFARLQREVDEPSLNLQDFRAKKVRYEQLLKLQQASTNRGQMVEQALAKVHSATCALQEFRRERFHREEATLRERTQGLPTDLELELSIDGDRQAFDAFLTSKLQGTGFRATSREKIVAAFANGIALYQRQPELEELLGGTADLDKLKKLLATSLADLLCFEVPTTRNIRFEGRPIQELSLGQRAMSLLMLLMGIDSYPIMLIDQPEDDLDNETIFEHVIKPLVAKKARCQFLVATHNPNIPVLGDAELVHACYERTKAKHEHDSGSLDSKATREAIVKVMEGGEQAFQQRQKVYRQWTKSLSEKNS